MEKGKCRIMRLYIVHEHAYLLTQRRDRIIISYHTSSEKDGNKTNKEEGERAAFGFDKGGMFNVMVLLWFCLRCMASGTTFLAGQRQMG